MKEETDVDLVILGGGPGGMTAAIYGAQAGLSTMLLETSVTGGLVNSTHTVANFPSYDTIHGMELMEKMRGHVDSLDVPVEEVCEVEKISLTGDIKTVETDEAIINARTVILATGRKPAPFYLDNDCDQVHHCAICDGGPYKGKNVLVVGGGNSAFDEGLYLEKIGVRHITIVDTMDRFFAAETSQKALLEKDNVEAYTKTRVTELIMEQGKLSGVVLENMETGESRTIDAEGIFVFLGQTPNNNLFENEIELSPEGYILAGEGMETNIPGVFGVGDINEKQFRQITTAMADGTIAALAAQRHLRKK